MREVWKDIKGYKGLYEISSHGRVKSVKRIILRRNGYKLPVKERLLKPGRLYSNGGDTYYLFANLSKNNKGKSFLVHRLVADAFIPRIKGKPEINHKNRIKNDNRVENLEWVNHYENNTLVYKSKSSKYPGVYKTNDNQINPWCAQLVVKRKNYHLGSFNTERKAFLAYKKALIKTNTVNKFVL